jgi:hypothetical protein
MQARAVSAPAMLAVIDVGTPLLDVDDVRRAFADSFLAFL